ncbi:MAG TPA: alpha/beta hydrolase [Stackebrandtia sp.]|uniref:alpha/beta fold hydrolase n=1 Tax=Stackebrandtia sp. TaxID=2023065 RepID=UPI002D6EAB95|nr:alpha/beta hydrolase [Stackebrandtia sp.]HZE37707.1 alpha/beta hydrolase [Stackebrandtia sp.]
MIREFDLDVGDGHTLHAYDTGPADARLTVLWHHGTPNIGTPPEPLFPLSQRLGIRWVGYDRPGYGGSTRQAGRTVGSAARLAAVVADHLGVERFATAGHSGGGPHALACGALLGDRVLAVACGSGPAPYGAEGLDYFAGMTSSGEASSRAAMAGVAAKEKYEAGAEFDPDSFTDGDNQALRGEWSWMLRVVVPAMESDDGGLVDDDIAYVSPWGFDPAEVTAPLLLVHGEDDRMVPVGHGRWLAEHCRGARLRTYPGEGHVSVLKHAESMVEWLADAAA